MPEFTVNATRVDPYKNFKFQVFLDGKTTPVAGVSRVSALTRTSQVVAHREGGDAHSMRKAPGQSDYGPITLERGVTHDVDFEQWANKTWDYTNSGKLGNEVSLADFRKSMRIVLYNIAGQVVIAYNVYRAWVSEFTALPELDANANAVAIQSIVLQNEGWERDYSVTEPTEPTFTLPAS